MPMPSDTRIHPSPAQVYELAIIYADLLRHVFSHPDFKYSHSPTATVAVIDYSRTPRRLFWVAEFLQNTYLNYILPFFPPDASRKCKELSNPWAYADPNYYWEWTWDAEAGVMKDDSGAVVEFPTLPPSELQSNRADIVSRNFFAEKLVLENDTDMKAQALVGGRPLDFGECARAAVRRLS